MTFKTLLLYALRDVIIAMLFIFLVMKVIPTYYVWVAVLILELIALIIDLGLKEHLLLKHEAKETVKQ